MNKRVRRILLGILAAMLLFGIVCVALPYRAVATGSPAVRDVAYAAEHWVSRSVLQNGVQAACTGGALRLDAGETARFTAELTQTGAYHVYAEYRVTDPAVTDNLVDISCGRMPRRPIRSIPMATSFRPSSAVWRNFSLKRWPIRQVLLWTPMNFLCPPVRQS